MAVQNLDPHELWESQEMKQRVKNDCAEWIGQVEWKHFITLTFEKEVVDENYATNSLKTLFHLLNKQAFGNHYTRKVGRTYFSYFWSMEKQLRGAYHFHILVDQPIDFDYLNSIWRNRYGICDYGSVVDPQKAQEYVCKHAIDGNFDFVKSGPPNSVYSTNKPSKPLHSQQ
jgi:hypothetical protein